MKEYSCKKDLYIGTNLFAKNGDYLTEDKGTWTNISSNKKMCEGKSPLVYDINEYFEELPHWENPKTQEDKVNHPSHYTWLKEKCGIEVIDITRHMTFCLGNAVKYLLRAGKKKEEGITDIDKTIEDLQKAIFYINDEIKTLKNEH